MEGISMGDNIMIIANCTENDGNFLRFLEQAKKHDPEIQAKKIIITRQEPQNKGKFILLVHGPRGDQLMRLTQFNGDEMDIIFKTIDEHKQGGGAYDEYYRMKYYKYKSKYLRLLSKLK